MTEELRPETLSDVQVLLKDHMLTRRLEWSQEGNIVYAKPKYGLPRGVFNMLFRKFRAMGGKWMGMRRGFMVELKQKEEA